MEELESLMQLYHMIYLACMVVMLLFLGMTALLFVRWRIWEAVGILSGRNASKAISGREHRTRGKVRGGKESRRIPEEADIPASVQGNTTEKLWFRETGGVSPGGRTMLLAENEEPAVRTGRMEAAQEEACENEMIILDEILQIYSTERI